MKPSIKISEALDKIASLLRQGGYPTQAQSITALRDAALSDDPAEHAFFRSEITGNKWYWLGMGTIADICLEDRQKNKEFLMAYCDLAAACETAGLSSIYSRDVADIFGGWLRKGAV